MAFWAPANDSSVISGIGSLIDAYNETAVSITQVLNHPDILQETRCENAKLMAFLARPEVLKLLLEHALNAEEYEKQSYVASEILTAGKFDIHNALVDGQDCLKYLITILDRPTPLNGLSVSYFSRIMEELALKQSDAFFSFLCSDTASLMKQIIKHFDCTPVVEMLSKIVRMPVEGALVFSRSLDDLDFIQNVVSLIETDNNCGQCASTFLCDLVKIQNTKTSDAKECQSTLNPLRSRIRSIQVINCLFHMVFDENANDSVLKNGLRVLIALVDTLLPDTYSASSLSQISHLPLNHGVDVHLPDVTIREIFINACLNYFPRINELLFNFSNYPIPISKNQTATYLPFSESRLFIVFFISRLVTFDCHDLSVFLNKLLPDLFFECFRRFPFNSYLHSALCQILKLLFTKSNLPDCLPQIINCITEVYEDLPSNSPCRGHVLEFMKLLVPHGRGPVWDRFIEEQQILETRIESLRAFHPSNTTSNFDAIQIAQLLNADDYFELNRQDELDFRHDSDEFFIESMTIPSPILNDVVDDDIDQHSLQECEVNIDNENHVKPLTLTLTSCSSITPTIFTNQDNFNAHWADFPSFDGWQSSENTKINSLEEVTFSSSPPSIPEDDALKVLSANSLSSSHSDNGPKTSEAADVLTNGELWPSFENKNEDCRRNSAM